MAKRKDIYTVDNIDAKNRIISDIINNNHFRKSSLDKIKKTIDSFKEQLAIGESPTELVGIALWSQFMPFEKFRIKYENMTTFYKEVTGNASDIGKDYTVREVYVHIPEMTGMLPYPDFSVISEYYSVIKNPDPPNTDTFEELRTNCFNEFEKILMYPRFYTTVLGQNSSWRFNEPCLVKTLGPTGMPSEVVGKLIKILESKKK